MSSRPAPTATEIYQVIKSSISKVADLRITRERYDDATAKAILGLLDEMARNSAQCVVMLLPDDDTTGDSP